MNSQPQDTFICEDCEGEHGVNVRKADNGEVIVICDDCYRDRKVNEQ